MTRLNRMIHSKAECRHRHNIMATFCPTICQGQRCFQTGAMLLMASASIRVSISDCISKLVLFFLVISSHTTILLILSLLLEPLDPAPESSTTLSTQD